MRKSTKFLSDVFYYLSFNSIVLFIHYNHTEDSTQSSSEDNCGLENLSRRRTYKHTHYVYANMHCTVVFSWNLERKNKDKSTFIEERLNKGGQTKNHYEI